MRPLGPRRFSLRQPAYKFTATAAALVMHECDQTSNPETSDPQERQSCGRERERRSNETVKRATRKNKSKEAGLDVNLRKKHPRKPEKGRWSSLVSYARGFSSCKQTTRPHPTELTCQRGHSGRHLWQGIMGQLCIMPTAGGHDIRPNPPLNKHEVIGDIVRPQSLFSPGP